jgi:O-antigen ligase/tetratricopeptide (TPR) repeat protein
MNKPPRAGRGSRPVKSAISSSRAPAVSGGAHLPLYLSRAILILAGFILFLPLVVSYDFYEPFVFLKSILFRIAAGAMAFLYVVLATLSPPHRPRLHRVTYALLAYLLVMVISSLPGVSVNSWSSWWGTFARMDGMFTQLHFLAFFFVLTQTLKSEREWLALFTTSLFAGLLVGLSGMLQYLGLPFMYRLILEARIMGATGNANNFAFLMVLDFFVVLWFLSRRDRRETNAFAAKVWLLLLILLDLFLVAWEVSALGRGPGVLSEGLALTPIAAFALLLHALSLFWFFKRDSVRVGSAFLGILGIYYLYWAYQSMTRFAVVGLVGSLVVLLLFYLWGGASRSMKWVAAASIAIVLLVPSIVFLNRHSSWVQGQWALARLTTVSFAAAAPRLMAWKAGALGIMDRPVLGWGPENYKNAFDGHFPPELFTATVSEAWYDRAHNMIVDIGTTTGILGLAACSAFYGLVFAALLGMWFRTRDATHSILVVALLLAYLIQNLFSFDTINTNGVVFLVLAYAAWLCGGERTAPDSSPLQPSAVSPIRWQGWLAIGFAGLAIAGSCWYLVKLPCDSNLLLARAVSFGRTRAPSGKQQYVFRQEIVDLYRQASDYQTTGRHEVRERFAGYASGLAHVSGIPLKDRAHVVEKAVNLLDESVRQEPSDARHRIYAVSLINRTLGVLQESDPALARALAGKALVLLQQAEKLSPTRPQVYIEKSRTLAWSGRTMEAVAALERAVNLSPWVKDLHVDLVTLYVSAGRYGDAAAEWEKARRFSDPLTREDYDKVIRSYESQKQLAPIAALYVGQLQNNPNDPDLLVHLAATYRDMGEIESARKAAMKAAALSPEVAATLQNFLDSLDRPR